MSALYDFSYSDPIRSRYAARRPSTPFLFSASALVPVLKQESDRLTILVPKGAKVGAGTTLHRVPKEGQAPFQVISVIDEQKEGQITKMVVMIDSNPRIALMGTQLEIGASDGLPAF